MSLSDAHDSLEEAIAGPEPEGEAPALGGEHEADRALARLARVRRQSADAVEVLEAHLELVRKWAADRLGLPVTITAKIPGLNADGSLDPKADIEVDGGLAGQATFLEFQLTQYHRAVVAKDPKRLSLSLPSGLLVSRQGQPEWEVTDEAALIAWAVANKRGPDVEGGIVRQKPAPDPEVDRNAMKAELVQRDEAGKKVVARGIDPRTGESPPGLKVHDAERNYQADTSPIEAE